MERILTVVVSLIVISVAADAQSVFTALTRSDYTITSCTTLGKSVTIQNGMVVSENSGSVSGDVTFNTKTNTVRFSNRRIKYNPASFIVKPMDSCCLTSASGTVVPDGGDVVFQIIEDFRHDEINMIVGWPDGSSVRLIATLKARKQL